MTDYTIRASAIIVHGYKPSNLDASFFARTTLPKLQKALSTLQNSYVAMRFMLFQNLLGQCSHDISVCGETDCKFADGALVVNESTAVLHLVTFDNCLPADLPASVVIPRGALCMLMESEVTINAGTFSNNRRAIYVSGKSNITIEAASFAENGNLVTNGGAIQAIESNILIIKSIFKQNNGGAIHASRSHLTILQTAFVENNEHDGSGGSIHIVDSHMTILSGIFESDDLRVGTQGQHIYAATPKLLLIRNVTFDPFEPNGDAGESMFVSGARGTNGVTLGDCTDQPCEPGQRCTYNKYSLKCTPCELGLFSDNGVTCTTCAAGKQPDTDRKRCLSCTGVTASVLGWSCEPCQPGETNNADRTACVDVDECATMNPPGSCDPFGEKISNCSTVDNTEVCQSVCQNLASSYRCGACPIGNIYTELRNNATGQFEGSRCTLPAAEDLPEGHETVVPQHTMKLKAVSSTVLDPAHPDRAALEAALVTDLEAAADPRQ